MHINPPSDVRLPAEWETQDAVMLTWPDDQSNWGDTIGRVDSTLAAVANAVSLYEKVVVACADPTHVRRILEGGNGNYENISLFHVRSNDLWARDHGPITVYKGGKANHLNFRFNGWGGKYPYALDHQINLALAEEGAWPASRLENLHLVLEGGAVESDGLGTLLLNSQCVLHPRRNGAITQEDFENVLREHLGAKRILWVHHGHLEGDDTDGHIDTLARFCSPDTIAYSTCERSEEAHFRQLQALESELKHLRTANNQPYSLVPLPLPTQIFDEAGEPLPANYTNFLIINGAVLIPTYNDPNDDVAMERISGLFPDRQAIGIDCRQVITQYGAVHCMTMQLPKGSLSN